MAFNLSQFGWSIDQIFWETSYQSLIIMLNSVDSEKKIKDPENAEQALAAFFGVHVGDTDAGR
ncbi:MAG: hypothetical protein WC169_12040 [Dehalococcoidia bacterium]|nr:hypothetical protein [Thermotogota bacterium]